MPISFAVVLLCIGRTTDVILESSMLDWKRRSIEVYVQEAGDHCSRPILADALVQTRERSILYWSL